MASRDIGTLRTRLSFEGDDVNKSLEGFRRDLRGLRSEMNLARSRGREYTQSLKGMREQSDILTRRLQVQQERVLVLSQFLVWRNKNTSNNRLGIKRIFQNKSRFGTKIHRK